MEANRLSEVIAQIYEAAAHPDRWHSVLAAIHSAIDAQHGAMYVVDTATGNLDMASFSNGIVEGQDLYMAHYAAKDPLTPALQALPTGHIYYDAQGVSMSDFKRSEYCNDFWERFDLGRTMGGVFLREGSKLGIVGVPRALGRPDYGEQERQTLELLLPHIRQAFMLGQQLEIATNAQVAASTVLDRMPYSALFLNGTGRVAHMNQPAERVLRQGDGLRIQGGRLVASDPCASRKLGRLIHETVRTGAGVGMHPGGTLLLFEPLSGEPITVQVSPFRNAGPSLVAPEDRIAGVVFISTASTPMPNRMELLMQLYSLTPAEARAAQKLGEGLTLAEIADLNGVTRETVRSQIKAAFAKTGTRRQTELVKLLLVGLPPEANEGL